MELKKEEDMPEAEESATGAPMESEEEEAHEAEEPTTEANMELKEEGTPEEEKPAPELPTELKKEEDKSDKGPLSPERVQYYQRVVNQIRKEIRKVVVGQEVTVDGFIRGLLCNGHVLVEGVPGIAKTLTIHSIAVATGCEFSRIQFTVDLLPTDIIGLTSYDKERGFYVIKGPLFANFILADEINRAPPKTQSAMLEAMQERQATIGKTTYQMMSPFFVMATQNPIESEGVYTLPEAQIDRFLFKLNMGYPNMDEEQIILRKNVTTRDFDEYGLKPVTRPDKLIALQRDVKRIFLSEQVERYIVKLVDATRNPNKYHIKSGRYIEWGASPRASIGLYIASKAEALMVGSTFVTPSHVKKVALDVLRHRVIVSYEGQAEDVSPDGIIEELLKRVPVP